MQLRGKHIVALYSVLCMLITASCTKDLKLPPIKEQNKLALIGELVAGDSVNIRAGESSPVGAGLFDLVTGISVNIKDTNGTTPLVGIEDSSSSLLKTIPFKADKFLTAGTAYTITASHASLGTASATITIPRPFVAAVKDTGGETYAKAQTCRFDIQINDPSGDNYYVVEAVKQKADVTGSFFYNNQWLEIYSFPLLYDSLKSFGVPVPTKFDTTYYPYYTRLNIYTNDVNTENLADGTAASPNRRILLKDNTFSNTSYTLRVFVAYTIDGSPYNWTKGRVLLQVKSVPAEYFKFLKAYEQYDASGSLNAPEQLVKLQGNINNGFGMVGAAYKLQFAYLFDTWSF